MSVKTSLILGGTDAIRGQPIRVVANALSESSLHKALGSLLERGKIKPKDQLHVLVEGDGVVAPSHRQVQPMEVLQQPPSVLVELTDGGILAH
jgi:hypothetical protein